MDCFCRSPQVYFAILETCDSTLLYPLLADMLKKSKQPCRTLQLLLDSRETAVGKCLTELLRLLRSWDVGGPTRQPWCLLVALGVDVRCPQFMGWARGQTLRLSSAIFRRYECKLACYPYCLWPLVDPRASDDKKKVVATRLLHAPRHQLDTYSYGIRRMFQSQELLTGFKCRSVLAADFASHPYGTDHIERLNAQLTQLSRSGGPGRASRLVSRASLVQQSHVVHVDRGGRDALEAPRKGAAITRERVAYLPILPPEGVDPSLGASPAAHLAGANVGAELLPLADLQPAPIVAAQSAQAAQVPIPAGMVVSERPCNSQLVPSSSNDAKPKGRRGLSPFMLQRNAYMASLKAQKGGGTLTQDAGDGRCFNRTDILVGRLGISLFSQTLLLRKGF